ncbi:MAG: hypothetical protein ABSH34_16110 [Verrucomicrobiota bacterium]|jgi:hypothetical protein
MSLFKQLEKLHRAERFQREDLHTEIVAQVLRNSRELTLEWLRSLNVTDLKKAGDIEITTQPRKGKEDSKRPLSFSLPAITRPPLCLGRRIPTSTLSPRDGLHFLDF